MKVLFFKRVYLFIAFIFLGTLLSGTSFAEEEAIFCSMEYAPVCAELTPDDCNDESCQALQKTFPNKCSAKSSGAKMISVGPCKNKRKIQNPENDPDCKAWFDGCNNCYRAKKGAPAFCTLRYCETDTMKDAYCKIRFSDDNTGLDLSTDEHESLNIPPIAMDEPGEIKPALPEGGKYEIIDDNLSSYSTDSKEKEETINFSGDIFKAYDDGSIFLNIKAGDEFKNKIKFSGFVDLAANGRWAYINKDKQNAFARLKIMKPNFEIMIERELYFNDSKYESAENRKLRWFDFDLNINRFDSGSYILQFENMNIENPASFRLTVKFKKDEQTKSLEDLIHDRYPDFDIVKVNNNSNEIYISKEIHGRLFWIIPISYTESLVLDKSSLLAKDKLQPWWANFVF